MTDVRTTATGSDGATSTRDIGLLPAFVVIVVVGAGLAFSALASALALLVAVAVVQALFAASWVFGTSMPGRWGGVVIAALASAGADVAVSVRPHERLGVLLTVLGLTLPAIFVHQLARGAARVQVVASMSAVTLLALAEVGLAALLQTRHEFLPSDTGGRVATAAVAAVALGVGVALLADMVFPVPRFDPLVPRGLLGLVLAGAAGAAVAVLVLRGEHQFAGARAGFVGAALGVLAGLVSVACSFVQVTTAVPSAAWAARLRPVITAVLPIATLAPVGFLLCLAIRS